MKTIYHYLFVLAAIFFCSSCNNEWETELYKKSVSFMQNGMQDIRIRYKEGGKTTYRLPVVVSGSQTNDQNYLVKVAIDKDTLNTMNFERFRDRDDLWYEYLEEDYWSVPAFEVNVPAGKNSGTLDIEFDLDNLNLSRKWVLPLTIVDDASYETNYRKHYRKSLLHIIPFNDYSGTYNGSTLNVLNTFTDQKQVLDNRNLTVVNENAVFLYAGVTDEELKERELYKIILTFKKTETYEENGHQITEGTLTLEAPNAEKIGFKAGSNNKFKIDTRMDEIDLYLERTTITLTLEYEYNELIPNTTAKIGYKVDGTMGMERRRNVTIPDEDQAWMW